MTGSCLPPGCRIPALVILVTSKHQPIGFHPDDLIRHGDARVGLWNFIGTRIPRTKTSRKSSGRTENGGMERKPSKSAKDGRPGEFSHQPSPALSSV